MTNKEKLEAAIKKGYFVTDKGDIFSKRGSIKPTINKQGYATFGVRLGKKVGVVGVHRLQAYQKFGHSIFGEDVVVRHLNGNPSDNSVDNISIGTHQDNSLDIPKLVRQRTAKYANKKYTNEDIKSWEKLNKSGVSYKKLEQMFNIPRSTFSYYLGKPDRKRQPVLFQE